MGSDWYIPPCTHKLQGSPGYLCSRRGKDRLLSFHLQVFFFRLFLIAKPAVGVENGEGGEGKRIW